MPSSPRKILIADDDPDILEILRYNLAQEGHEVITAKDGDEALEKARKHAPDLIVLDVMMPRKTGVEVCQLLRTQTAFQKTLIIFLNSDKNTIQQRVNLRKNHFMAPGLVDSQFAALEDPSSEADVIPVDVTGDLQSVISGSIQAINQYLVS